MFYFGGRQTKGRLHLPYNLICYYKGWTGITSLGQIIIFLSGIGKHSNSGKPGAKRNFIAKFG